VYVGGSGHSSGSGCGCSVGCVSVASIESKMGEQKGVEMNRVRVCSSVRGTGNLFCRIAILCYPSIHSLFLSFFPRLFPHAVHHLKQTMANLHCSISSNRDGVNPPTG